MRQFPPQIGRRCCATTTALAQFRHYNGCQNGAPAHQSEGNIRAPHRPRGINPRNLAVAPHDDQRPGVWLCLVAEPDGISQKTATSRLPAPAPNEPLESEFGAADPGVRAGFRFGRRTRSRRSGDRRPGAPLEGATDRAIAAAVRGHPQPRRRPQGVSAGWRQGSPFTLHIGVAPVGGTASDEGRLQIRVMTRQRSCAISLRHG